VAGAALSSCREVCFSEFAMARLRAVTEVAQTMAGQCFWRGVDFVRF